MKFYELLKYFLSRIFFNKSRNYLLLLCFFAISVSSFSLYVINGVMSGLQASLKNRSKSFEGNFAIFSTNKNKFGWSHTETNRIVVELAKYNISAYESIELELLLKSDNEIFPVILNGFNKENVPGFLKEKNFDDLVLGGDVAYLNNIMSFDKVHIISPNQMNQLLGEKNRFVSTKISDIITTNTSDLDQKNGWVRSSLLFNLTRTKLYNKISLFSSQVNSKNYIKEILDRLLEEKNYILKSWEEMNSTLVWSLKLETSVMITLFSMTCILIAVTMTSAFSVFLNKLKVDFLSFWILGTSLKTLKQSFFIFLSLFSLISSMLGVFIGRFFLYIIENYLGEVLPDVFVDRTIPVEITFLNGFFSIIFPFVVSLFLSYSFLFYKNSSESAITDQKDLLGLLKRYIT